MTATHSFIEKNTKLHGPWVSYCFIIWRGTIILSTRFLPGWWGSSEAATHPRISPDGTIPVWRVTPESGRPLVGLLSGTVTGVATARTRRRSQKSLGSLRASWGYSTQHVIVVATAQGQSTHSFNTDFHNFTEHEQQMTWKRVITI